MANVKRVLIVDDEPTIADTLAIILNKAGFNASAVYSGTEAVEVAKSVKPDLIISDVAMSHKYSITAGSSSSPGLHTQSRTRQSVNENEKGLSDV